MRRRSRRGSGTVGAVGAVGAAAALSAALVALAATAGAQSPVTVVITEADLDWLVGDETYGRMAWSGFGQEASRDALCSNLGLGGPITTVRFELRFDLSTDPATLAGTLSGTMVAGAGEEEWASGSFSGPIVGGWARQTPEGWAWGGSADLSLDFAGARTCLIVSDESGAAIDHIVAEGEGQRRVSAEFSGGPGAWGEGTGGFRLLGSGGSFDYSAGQVGDGWSIDLGCVFCEVPVVLPEDTPNGGDQSVSSVPQQPGSGALTPAEDAGEDPWPALFGGTDSGRRQGWSPLGVLILILLLVAVIGFGVPVAVRAVLAGLSDRRDFPLRRRFSEEQVKTLADSAQAHRARDWAGPPVDIAVVRPVELRLGPGERESGQPHRLIGAWLRPGQRYQVVGEKQIGAWQDGGELWLEVRVGDQAGWVPHSAVVSADRVPSPPPIPPPGWEVVQFPNEVLMRRPGSTEWVKKPPGRYRLGNRNAEGLRPVYTPRGKLVGLVDPAHVPPPPPPPKPVRPWRFK